MRVSGCGWDGRAWDEVMPCRAHCLLGSSCCGLDLRAWWRRLAPAFQMADLVLASEGVEMCRACHEHFGVRAASFLGKGGGNDR